jgi:transcriptional regulator with XRE-family HTH domain
MFGERIRLLRKEKGMTLRALSEELEIPFTTLGNYERGDRQPSFETFKALADYFEVSIDYLVGRVDARNMDEYLLQTDFELLDQLLKQTDDPNIRSLTANLFDRLYSIVTNNEYRVPVVKELELLTDILDSVSEIKKEASYTKVDVQTPYEYAKKYLMQKESIDKSLNKYFQLLIKLD